MSRAKLTLVLILIVGVILRFYGLDKNPPSLNWDEVSHGYNAYSILKTGQDEWGQLLPITNFRAYGDYPTPLYMYLSMPGILLFGLNEFSIRLPSALFGSLMIIVVYLLVTYFLKNTKLSLLAAFLVAISPWGILTSRQVLQATPAILFLSLGVWLFLKGISSGFKWSIFGLLCIGISAYAYHNTRILAPAIFILLLFMFRINIKKSKVFLVSSLLIFSLFFLPLIPVVLSPTGSARIVWVGILDEGAINEINKLRQQSNLSPALSEILYNKFTYFLTKSASNYLGYFSPTYLGLEGGTQYQFSVPHFGVIYPVELPFFYLGLLMLVLGFKKHSADKKFLLTWLILSPIPAAITRDSYQVVRSMTMMPVVFIITVLGWGIFLSWFKGRAAKFKPAVLTIFLIIIVTSLVNYFYNFWFIYPQNYSFAWQYGYREVADYIKQNAGQYDQIFITKKYGEPHEFLLFYLQYDPAKYQQDPNLIRYPKSNWYWVDRFDKYYFVNDWEVKNRVRPPEASLAKGGNENLRMNSLLITSPGNYPSGSKFLQTTNFLDGKPAFDIVELPQVQ